MKPFFHEQLKEARKALHLSQIKAAELLEVPFRTYCDWERGVTKPHLVTQEGCLARMLKVK